MKIDKIFIKGTSGYCAVDDSYNDKLTVTASSIAYEYKPYLEDGFPMQRYRKWSYKTNSPEFARLFEHAAVYIQEYLRNGPEIQCQDAGMITFTATYEDKHKETMTCCASPDFFEKCFVFFREMVPPCEEMPNVLGQPEDDEDDEEDDENDE